jgi:hypothetical protein
MDLGRHQVGIPQLPDHHRYVEARNGCTPLLDHPIVVSADTQVSQRLILGRQEPLAGEPREGRETQTSSNTVTEQVAGPNDGVIATLNHVVVSRRVHGEVLVRLARDGVQTHGRDLIAPVLPYLSAVVFGQHPGTFILPFRGQPISPHARRLDDVIIDTDEIELWLENHRTPLE